MVCYSSDEVTDLTAKKEEMSLPLHHQQRRHEKLPSSCTLLLWLLLAHTRLLKAAAWCDTPRLTGGCGPWSDNIHTGATDKMIFRDRLVDTYVCISKALSNIDMGWGQKKCMRKMIQFSEISSKGTQKVCIFHSFQEVFSQFWRFCTHQQGSILFSSFWTIYGLLFGFFSSLILILNCLENTRIHSG